MAEYTPSIELKKIIAKKLTEINSTTVTLTREKRPFDTLKSLQKQMDELKTLIENEKDDRIVARLKRQLESLSAQYDRVRKSITQELEQRVKDLEKTLEVLNKELEQLNKELGESLKYEEELRIRAAKTVVRLINVGQFLGGDDSLSSLSLTVNQGQRLEYVRSVDSGNIYMKLSKLGITEEFVGTVKSIDYKSIFVQEDKFIGDVILPERPIKELDKSDSIMSNGSETIYYTQVIDFQTTLRINVSLGFIAVDVDRQDGDLSLWVLLSSGGKVVEA